MNFQNIATKSYTWKSIKHNTSWSGPSLDLVHKHLTKKIKHTWAPPATTKGPFINTIKGHAFRTRSRARPVPTIHAVRKRQSCLLQDSGSFRGNLYGPNRKFTSHIKQRKQVYPGRLLLQLKYNPCWTPLDNIRPGFNISVPKTPHIVD